MILTLIQTYTIYNKYTYLKNNNKIGVPTKQKQKEDEKNNNKNRYLSVNSILFSL